MSGLCLRIPCAGRRYRPLSFPWLPLTLRVPLPLPLLRYAHTCPSSFLSSSLSFPHNNTSTIFCSCYCHLQIQPLTATHHSVSYSLKTVVSPLASLSFRVLHNADPKIMVSLKRWYWFSSRWGRNSVGICMSLPAVQANCLAYTRYPYIISLIGLLNRLQQ